MRRAAFYFLFVLYGHCVFDVVRCAECHSNRCRLEDNCLCASNLPPGNLTASEMPQFVMLTFDDAVNEENIDFYRELLAPGRRRNQASGCNVAATFFVSAGYTYYSFVHELHSTGNEIALHSITHLNNMTYWRTLGVAGWEAEFLGVRQLLKDYALIPERDMVGARAPFLEIGHGKAYDMMRKHGFLYDSSITAKLDYLPLFPHTLDFGVQGVCDNTVCPSGAYKGLWVVPLNMFFREEPNYGKPKAERACVMPDNCRPLPSTASDMFDFLRSNFERYYKTNRAPFPVFIHENWLWNPERKRGFLAFVDWLLTKKDVFLVTVEDVVHFMRDPKPLSKYSQKKCSRATRFQQCPKIYSCPFPESLIAETKILVGCKPCPKKYPWIENFIAETQDNRAVSATAASQSYGAVFIVLFCCGLVLSVCIAAKLSSHMFHGNGRKESHIL